MVNIEYGLQMYSLYDITDKDLKGALKKVAEMGYKDIQFAGYFGHSAEEVREWLNEYGLDCTSAHVSSSGFAEDNIEETIAYHKALGCNYLIVPAIKFHTQEVLDENIAILNRAQKRLAEEGMRLGYHNHSQEFVPTPFGVIAMDEILSRTNCEIEIDTFWAYNANVDPVTLMERIKDRIRVIHIKDGIPNTSDSKDFDHIHCNVKHKALGEGTAPVAPVWEWAIKNNVQMVVESEGLDPTGLEEVKRCMDFLRSLEE